MSIGLTHIFSIVFRWLIKIPRLTFLRHRVRTFQLMKVTYETSAAKASQLPVMSLPEIAFIGRSNVGKSSLLNSLLNFKGLARTSRTPGRTQMANFFRVADQYYFVDLPGYGFASGANRDHEAWQELMQAYLRRNVIKHFLFLWDPRRDLVQMDLELARELGSRAPMTLVLTKIDKLSRSEFSQRKVFLESALRSSGVNLKSTFGVSSLKKTGMPELQAEILVTDQSLHG
jgi:GTP-binding protein